MATQVPEFLQSDFFIRNNMKMTDCICLLSVWRGETSWRTLANGYPTLELDVNTNCVFLIFFEKNSLERCFELNISEYTCISEHPNKIILEHNQGLFDVSFSFLHPIIVTKFLSVLEEINELLCQLSILPKAELTGSAALAFINKVFHMPNHKGKNGSLGPLLYCWKRYNVQFICCFRNLFNNNLKNLEEVKMLSNVIVGLYSIRDTSLLEDLLKDNFFKLTVEVHQTLMELTDKPPLEDIYLKRRYDWFFDFIVHNEHGAKCLNQFVKFKWVLTQVLDKFIDSRNLSAYHSFRSEIETRFRKILISDQEFLNKVMKNFQNYNFLMGTLLTLLFDSQEKVIFDIEFKKKLLRQVSKSFLDLRFAVVEGHLIRVTENDQSQEDLVPSQLEMLLVFCSHNERDLIEEIFKERGLLEIFFCLVASELDRSSCVYLLIETILKSRFFAEKEEGKSIICESLKSILITKCVNLNFYLIDLMATVLKSFNQEAIVDLHEEINIVDLLLKTLKELEGNRRKIAFVQSFVLELVSTLRFLVGEPAMIEVLQILVKCTDGRTSMISDQLCAIFKQISQSLEGKKILIKVFESCQEQKIKIIRPLYSSIGRH